MCVVSSYPANVHAILGALTTAGPLQIYTCFLPSNFVEENMCLGKFISKSASVNSSTNPIIFPCPILASNLSLVLLLFTEKQQQIHNSWHLGGKDQYCTRTEKYCYICTCILWWCNCYTYEHQTLQYNIYVITHLPLDKWPPFHT